MKREVLGSQERWGKAAERIRRLDAYREAKTIMVSLDRVLHQVRLNVLSDRKPLILPSPGLHKGFLFLDPVRIPVSKWDSAVRPHQSLSFGKRIRYDTALKNPIEVIIVEALAVGLDGSRLGDGSGHLDLQCAILSSLDWSHSQMQIISVVSEKGILSSVPLEETDVKVHWIVTPQRVIKTLHIEPVKREVIWKKLSSKQIRRNDALFHLYRHRLKGEG
jgi:5-formyltetrahydrofolate cyclo-ligase